MSRARWIAAAQVTDKVEQLESSSRQPDIGCRPLGFGDPPWGLNDYRWSMAIAPAA
jgi:hypothetical protein